MISFQFFSGPSSCHCTSSLRVMWAVVGECSDACCESMGGRKSSSPQTPASPTWNSLSRLPFEDKRIDVVICMKSSSARSSKRRMGSSFAIRVLDCVVEIECRHPEAPLLCRNSGKNDTLVCSFLGVGCELSYGFGRTVGRHWTN